MCGIAGYLSPVPLSQAKERAALRVLGHRGPDGSGIERTVLSGEYLSLLHTRLSVIDLDERAGQPFKKDGMILTFNGEIYNYIELKKDLEKLGHSFRTQSDTEVVLEAYRAWGENCVEHFEGMWAIALFDSFNQQLWLSRDRFGEKPLFIWRQSGVLMFASEVKALAYMSGSWPDVNEEQIVRFLVNGFKSINKKSQTWFKNVQELPASFSAVILNSKNYHTKRYWSLAYNPVQMTIEDAVSEVRARLLQAMKIRLRSDVPVAFCLSGGVDSGTLASIAAKKFQHPIHAFSIVDSDPRYNESNEINAVVSDLGCDQHVVELNCDGFLDRMERLVAGHDAPVSTISYYIHSFLSEAISEHGFKVAISGTGADEIFTGYYDHYSFWLSQMHDRPEFQELLEDWKRSYGSHVRNPFLKDPMTFVRDPGQRGHIYLNREQFNSVMIQPTDENFFEETYSNNTLRNRMLNELQHEIVPVMLREDDLNSMHWSVENRSPYLDRRLVEFAYTIPDECLIHEGYAKWVLRAAAEGLLVDKVRLCGQKRGFNASIESLIDCDEPDTVERLLSPCRIFDFVKREEIEKLIFSDLSSNSYSKFMFSFISAKLFLDRKTPLVY